MDSRLSVLAVRAVAKQRNSAAPLISCSCMIASDMIKVFLKKIAKRDTDGCNIFCLTIEADDDEDDDNVFSLQAASGQTQRSGWWSIS